MIDHLRRALRWHTPLMAFAVAMTATAVFAAVEYSLDDRILVGVPIWAKPLLFSISFAVYAVTLAWLISRLRNPRAARLARRAGTVLAVATGLEMVAIVTQVVRGQQSHFNYSTPFNTAVFGAMGAMVVVIFAATVAVGVALLRERTDADRPTAWALRLGLLVSLAGMSVGFLMVAPRPSQATGAAIRGAHSVGVADGGPSLPVVGWSTTGGDLRVPHFLGLHALQAFPLLALALMVLPVTARLSVRCRTRLVAIGAGGYTALFAISLWQALRGQSIVHPDAWTIAAIAALVVGVTLAVLAALRAERPRTAGSISPRVVAYAPSGHV